MRRATLLRFSASVALAALAAVACSESSDSLPASGAAADSFGPASLSPKSMSAERALPPAPPSAAPALADMSAAADAVTATAVPAVEMPSPTASQGSLVPAMVIRTGNATLQVQTLDPALGRVRQLASQLGGYVGNTTMQGGKDQPRSASIELKVPADQFDRAVSGLSPIGKVETVNVTAQDVGEEYVDISARVANAQRLEARLLDLLGTRTANLGDMLTVERELARVREEIERYEGRLRFLKSRAAVSSLSITMHEPALFLGPNAAPNPIAQAFREAWRNFVGLLAVFIASLGVLIPLGAIALVLWWIGKRWLPREPKTPPATA